jgi:hypothetical protein
MKYILILVLLILLSQLIGEFTVDTISMQYEYRPPN